MGGGVDSGSVPASSILGPKLNPELGLLSVWRLQVLPVLGFSTLLSLRP